MPRELLDNTSRFIPGAGVSPLTAMLRTLEDQYAGPLSVGLFLPTLREADPYETAREIRRTCEAVMRTAAVL